MAPPFLQVFKAFIQSFGDMGDIIDMAIKANDGKATYDVGELTDRDTTGTIVSLTASSTKDLYLAGATVSLILYGTGVQLVDYQIHLMRNTTTLEIWAYKAYIQSGDFDYSRTHIFKTVGAKVTTSETFSLNLAEVGTTCDVYGSIYGWQEDTGVGPEI